MVDMYHKLLQHVQIVYRQCSKKLY